MTSFANTVEIVEYKDPTWNKAAQPLRLRARLTVDDQEAISRSIMGEFHGSRVGEPVQFLSPMIVAAHILFRMVVKDEQKHMTVLYWKQWLEEQSYDTFNRLEAFLNARYAAGHMPVRRTPQRPDKPPDWAPSDRLDALQFVDATDDD